MNTTATFHGDLNLGHVLAAAGVDPGSVLVIRHTYRAGDIESPAGVTEASVLAYTRKQSLINKVGRKPPRLWLVFITDGKLRSRFFAAYDNFGELPEEQTEHHRYFDLRRSDVLISLADRLVIEWSRDAVNWAKQGKAATSFPIVEISDPVRVPFPGFNRLLITFEELQLVVEDRRYAEWQSALRSMQGVYLIADLSTGKQYVGKADGVDGILGRWTSYARDAHGGNVVMRELSNANVRHRENLQFSILQVFDPTTLQFEIDATESHYKRALCTVKYGLNGA